MNFRVFMQRSAEEIELVRLRSRITKRFHKACADYGLIADGDHILVGVSGGKDSLALVELLGKRAQVYVPRFKVTAVYVRLKERSYQSDIAYLSRFCASVHVPFIVRDAETGEDAKREADGVDKREKDPCFLCSWYRRKVLFDVAQELGCNKIALGHHKDDIVETLLLIVYVGLTLVLVLHVMQYLTTMLAIATDLYLLHRECTSLTLHQVAHECTREGSLLAVVESVEGGDEEGHEVVDVHVVHDYSIQVFCRGGGNLG